MCITIEDYDKVDDIKKFATDYNITINWEKDMTDGICLEISGDVSNVNILYDMVVKINRVKNSNFFGRLIHFIFH